MEIYYKLENLSSLPGKMALAIGNFDGLHLGHQKILKFLVRESQRKNLMASVLTFSPHPERVLGKSPVRMIQTLEQRLKGMEAFGVRAVVVASFGQKFSHLSSQDFIQRVIVHAFKASLVIVGRNFRFGQNREGNISTLRHFSREFGFKVHSIPPVRKKGKIVSSSLIRHLLQEGKIEEANKFLGRFYEVEGDVIPGDTRGKSIGFPTANILTPNEIIPLGVFITLSEIDSEKLPSLTNIGTRPTFGQKKINIESHILGFHKNIYGEKIKILFLKKIREERKFKDSEELSFQIKKDLDMARKYFRRRFSQFLTLS